MAFIADEEIRHIITPAIKNGEILLWAGRPRNVSYDFTALIGLLIAIGLVYYFFGESLASDLGYLRAENPIAFVPLIIFILALLWQFRAVFLPANQIYALTDQRMLVWQRFWPRTMRALPLENLSKIARSKTGAKNDLLLWFTAKGFSKHKQEVGFQVISFPFVKAGGVQLYGIEEPELLIDTLQKIKIKDVRHE